MVLILATFKQLEALTESSMISTGCESSSSILADSSVFT